MLASTVRADRLSAAAAISGWTPPAGSPAGPEREVVPFAYAGAAILHPRLFDGAPGRAPSRSTCCSTRRSRPGGCSACAWTASGCMSARPEAIGEAEHVDRRQRGLTATMAASRSPASSRSPPACRSSDRWPRRCSLAGSVAFDRDDPLALAGVTVLLPTRRAVRAFRDVLIRQPRRRCGDPAGHPADRRCRRGGSPARRHRSRPAAERLVAAGGDHARSTASSR